VLLTHLSLRWTEDTNQANVGCLNTILYHVKQQSSGNSCGFFVCINMLCFGSQPFTNVSVSPFICTLPSSFIFTHAFHLLLIHFLVISWQDYVIEFINKNGSSLEHIRERIAEFLVTQVIDPKWRISF
jgi:hypothetical protein